jgi:hypothetical protein
VECVSRKDPNSTRQRSGDWARLQERGQLALMHLAQILSHSPHPHADNNGYSLLSIAPTLTREGMTLDDMESWSFGDGEPLLVHGSYFSLSGSWESRPEAEFLRAYKRKAS